MVKIIQKVVTIETNKNKITVHLIYLQKQFYTNRNMKRVINTEVTSEDPREEEDVAI